MTPRLALLLTLAIIVAILAPKVAHSVSNHRAQADSNHASEVCHLSDTC